jgi:phytoene/squalene synthetase
LPGYCEALVRKFDYDRYLSALFAPEAVRPDLFALYALNVEIARIAELVRNPVAGQIRLQWWRDGVEEIFSGGVARNEILKAVTQAITRHELPKPLFHMMIDSREQDLEACPFQDFTNMKSYADATSGALMRLAARVIGAGTTLDQTAHEAGMSYAITGLLRAIPFHAACSRVMIPMDEMEQAGVTSEQILHRQMSANVSLLIQRMTGLARALHPRVASTERRFLPAILPAALVPAFLRLLSRSGFNPFRDSAEIAVYRRQWIMLRAMAQRHV